MHIFYTFIIEDRRLEQRKSHKVHYTDCICIYLNICTLYLQNIYIYKKVSKVGDHSRGWPEGSLFDSLLHQGVGEGATPFPGLLHFTLDPYLIMLSVKQGGIKYHFLSLWYDSTWDWTQVSRAIGVLSETWFRLKYLSTNTFYCIISIPFQPCTWINSIVLYQYHSNHLTVVFVRYIRMSWKVYIMTSYLFWVMGFKHCNNERSVWTTGRTMLKNKLHLVTFHESILVSL